MHIPQLRRMGLVLSEPGSTAHSSLSAVWALHVTMIDFAGSHRAKVGPFWRAGLQATSSRVRPRARLVLSEPSWASSTSINRPQARMLSDDQKHDGLL